MKDKKKVQQFLVAFCICMSINCLIGFDYLQDGCLATPLSNGQPVCGDDVKSELYTFIVMFSLIPFSVFFKVGKEI